jgi:peptide/nickel transport system permease protein
MKVSQLKFKRSSEESILSADVSQRTKNDPEIRKQTWWSSPTGRAVGRLIHDRAGLVALAILVLIIIMSIVAPVIAPYDPLKMSFASVSKPPSQLHWFGTDQFGRDILSRVIYGARYSVPLGIIPVVIGMTCGTILGLIAGFTEGILRRVIMRSVDVLLGFPLFLLALFIVAMLGPSLVNAMIAVGISTIPNFARVVYGGVLSIKERTFILASKALGVTESRILLRHIFPNVLAPIIVIATMGMAYAILTGAALSFLGLGAQPPTPEWGAMVYEGRGYLRSFWWISTMPGLMIMITVLAVNVFGDAMRDALDPRLIE